MRTRRIPFAVIGAAALAVHGVARSTLDLDLLAVSPECLDASTWHALSLPAVAADIRHGDVDDPLAGVVRFTRGGAPPVDLVVGKSAWQAGILARARTTVLEGAAVPVATAADLILLKLYAGGPQDAWDIEQLLATGDRTALAADLEPRLTDLPDDARRLWARIATGPTR